MQHLLLVGNPAKRKAKRRTTKRAASPAQKRARAAFAAASRARSSKRRTVRKTRRAAPSTTIRSNPVKHRKHARRSNPIAHRKHHRRTRRNPISAANMGAITSQLKTAAVGAGGALAVDVAWGYLGSMLPASIATEQVTPGTINYAYYAAKMAGAIGLGMLLRKVSPRHAAAMVQGSLTVTMHKAATAFLTTAGTTASAVPLAMYPGRLAGRNPAQVVQLPSPARMGHMGHAGGMGMYAGNVREREGAAR